MNAESSCVNEELMTYTLRVNGAEHIVNDAWAGENLLFVLRERLALPGAKNACEEGECGSCSVLIDDALVCACLVLAASVTGQHITTVEGLIGDASTGMNVVQEAFVVEGAVQCGFCTPGLIVSVHHLLSHNADPSELEIREAISGNLCRCTGYGRILEAINVAVKNRRK